MTSAQCNPERRQPYLIDPDAHAAGAENCLTCWGADGSHQRWCWRGQYTLGEALRDARDLEFAIAWEPPELNLPPLSPAEREQLALLLDALIALGREDAA